MIWELQIWPLLKDKNIFLYCYAKGIEGSNYELSIVEPREISFSIFKTIDTSKEQKGKYAFSIKLEEVCSTYLA